MVRYVPKSSYRLNLSKDFPFSEAEKLIPYLYDLGIEMVYLSPYFKTEKNSLNPYKTISLKVVDEELGGEAGFNSFCEELLKYKMTHMIDVVPNHMGASCQNKWWYDVLRFGRESEYAEYFDIDWEAGGGQSYSSNFARGCRD